MVIALGLSVVVLVSISLTAYVAFVGTIGYGEIASVAVVAVLVAFATYIVWDRARSVSKGLPASDERLKHKLQSWILRVHRSNLECRPCSNTCRHTL